MIKEREELIELLIKIDKFRNKGNFTEKESQKRIIKILRSGIKPSKGLKEAIDSLQNKYSTAGQNDFATSMLLETDNRIWI